jgi:N-formylglutamate deformylase
MGAATVHTRISPTVIDVNRDPANALLHPEQATGVLVPTTIFDGEPLWRMGMVPDAAESVRRMAQFFGPYHVALAREIARFRAHHLRVALYDCHAIRAVIPRLFPGELAVKNIATNSRASCDLDLAQPVVAIAAASRFSPVVNGRFKGGYTTRRSGAPAAGIHAPQMELAWRGYLEEPIGSVDAKTWPAPYDEAYGVEIRATLRAILETCLRFAKEGCNDPHR